MRLKEILMSRRYKVRLIALCGFVLFSTVACAGSQLTPDEEKRYQSLQEERNQIANERAQLARQVQQDFAESGRLEKQKKVIAKQALNCGYSLNKKAFGPLPFKKKKGKKAVFGNGKKAKRSGCSEHSFKVK